MSTTPEETTPTREIMKLEKNFKITESVMPVYDLEHYGAIKEVAYFVENYTSKDESSELEVTTTVFITLEEWYDDELEYHSYVGNIYESYDIADLSEYPDIESAARSIIFTPETDNDGATAVFG